MCGYFVFWFCKPVSKLCQDTLFKGGKNWSRYFYPCYRRCCAGGGGAAQWGWFWPAYSSALLPEHAGADGGQREDRCSVCCPVDCCRIHQHPALPHWEDLWCGAGTQKGIRWRKMDAVPGVKPHSWGGNHIPFLCFHFSHEISKWINSSAWLQCRISDCIIKGLTLDI